MEGQHDCHEHFSICRDSVQCCWLGVKLNTKGNQGAFLCRARLPRSSDNIELRDTINFLNFTSQPLVPILSMSSTDCAELDGESAQAVENEIRDLEEQLARAKGRLKAQKTVVIRGTSHNDARTGSLQPATVTSIPRGKPFSPT